MLYSTSIPRAIWGAAKWLWKTNPKAAVGIGILLAKGVESTVQSAVKVVKKVTKK